MSEYGWTIKQAMSLSMAQALLLLDSIQKRKSSLWEFIFRDGAKLLANIVRTATHGKRSDMYGMFRHLDMGKPEEVTVTDKVPEGFGYTDSREKKRE